MADALIHERRATPRMSTYGRDGMERARLRPGRTARVLDLSAGGALIESDWRMLPGMRVELQLGEPKTLFTVAARILRCHVALLDRERIRYRGALAFDERLPLSETAAEWVERGTEGK
jgi:hypothetical protein